MPLNYRVYDYKFFNEQTNGSDFSLNPTDFTENLVGNVGTKIKVEFLVYFEWFTDASNGQDTLYSEPALNQISRHYFKTVRTIKCKIIRGTLHHGHIT